MSLKSKYIGCTMEDLNDNSRAYNDNFEAILNCQENGILGSDEHIELLAREEFYNSADEGMRKALGLLENPCPLYGDQYKLCDACSGYLIKEVSGKSPKTKKDILTTYEITKREYEVNPDATKCMVKFYKEYIE